MKNQLKFFAAGVVLALVVSFAGIPGAYQYYRYKVDTSLKMHETEMVKSTIKFFSSTVAGFYATGGIVAGLNIFPAEKAVKHRIFQDIRNWQNTGKVLVMDKDKSTVKNVTFITPDRVIAVVDESWYNVYQDYKTRRPISDKKANLITVRYFLKKQWGKWIVIEYEVYKQGDALPLVPVDRVITW